MLGFPCCKGVRILYYILFLTGSHCDTQAGLELRIFMLSILGDPFFEENSAVSQGCMTLHSRRIGLLPWEPCGMKHGSSSAHVHWPFYFLYWIETARDLHGERVDTKVMRALRIPSLQTISEYEFRKSGYVHGWQSSRYWPTRLDQSFFFPLKLSFVSRQLHWWEGIWWGPGDKHSVPYAYTLWVCDHPLAGLLLRCGSWFFRFCETLNDGPCHQHAQLLHRLKCVHRRKTNRMLCVNYVFHPLGITSRYLSHS